MLIVGVVGKVGALIEQAIEFEFGKVCSNMVSGKLTSIHSPRQNSQWFEFTLEVSARGYVQGGELEVLP